MSEKQIKAEIQQAKREKIEKPKELIKKIGSYQKSNLRFEVGIQSTNPIVNKSIRRTQNMDLLKENVLLLNAYPNITLHVDLIAGLPYEDLTSFKNSFNETFSLFAGELQLGFLKFLKGTHLMTLIDEHKYTYDPKTPYEIIDNKYISKDELKEITAYHAKRYYDEDDPEISDFEYDMLMVELKNLENSLLKEESRHEKVVKLLDEQKQKWRERYD